MSALHPLLLGSSAPHTTVIESGKLFRFQAIEGNLVVAWKEVDTHFYSIRWNQVATLRITGSIVRIELLCDIINRIGSLHHLSIDASNLSSSQLMRVCRQIGDHVRIDKFSFNPTSISRFNDTLPIDIPDLCGRTHIQEVDGLCQAMSSWEEHAVKKMYHHLALLELPPILVTHETCNRCYHNTTLAVSILHRKLYQQRRDYLTRGAQELVTEGETP